MFHLELWIDEKTEKTYSKDAVASVSLCLLEFLAVEQERIAGSLELLLIT